MSLRSDGWHWTLQGQRKTGRLKETGNDIWRKKHGQKVSGTAGARMEQDGGGSIRQS